MKKKLYRLIKDNYFKYKVKDKQLNVLWCPKINNRIDLYRELSRIVWYLNPIKDKIETISLSVNNELCNEKIIFPTYVDANIKKLYKNLKNKIKFFTEDQTMLNNYHVVVQWSRVKIENDCNLKGLFPYFINASIYDNQFEANQIVKFSSFFLEKGEIQKNNEKLREFLITLRQQNVDFVYLFGSGPSLNVIDDKKIDFSNSISIICNSVVKNIPLLKKINPRIMVATDAVFHSGYSRYAGEFRKSLLKALDMFEDMYFFVPMRDLLLYQNNLPSKYKTRIIGIEAKRKKFYNIDLIRKQHVKSTSNVLTFFLLPIAATISNRIRLVGFDGRSENDKNIFWQYDKNSQFLNIIESTKLAHPGFYKINYNDYFFRHCLETEKLINNITQNNITVEVLGNTNIPILKRYILND